MQSYINQSRQIWKDAWYNKAFRANLILGVIIIVGLLIFTYHFFYYIEHLPGGTLLNDWVLRKIPAEDVSVPITLLESSVIIIFLIRSITNPNLFVTYLIGFIFILIFRIITIYITQLQPPVGLIELRDPIAGIVYKSTFIKRDLFYSGHVSIMYLFYLCSIKKVDKYYILFAVTCVGLLLLVQHVHYTIDVISAPFFAFGCFWLSKKFMRFRILHSTVENKLRKVA
ncbi:MAG TPA: phosphatase PAP2-related protein [Bacteroidia bacterium]|nr:phosphatase PAP2-related protein [Bacteroidia bacterium]